MKKKKKSMYPGGGHFKKKPNANMPKQQMRMGGKLKPVDKDKNPGLAKLPTDVRNKMGFMEMGGKMSDTDKDFMYGGKMMKKMAMGGAFKKIKEKRDDMMKRYKGFTGTSGSGISKQDKPKRRKKKMMKGGKMNYPGGGMMKKGSMYPGGGRMQHD